MLSQRQKELLKFIVEDYIKTARPIGSKSLCNLLKCSSATIRNEMSLLEEMGLLEKTHTSSGRIPSEQGYRYYVDNIMKPKELSGEDVLKLQTIFRNNSLMLSDTIIKSMEIISELTSYTSVVLGKSSKDNKISRVEVIPLDQNSFIAIVVTDKGHVEHKKMFIKEAIKPEEIKQVVEIINHHIIGTPVDEVSEKLEYEVKPIIGNEIKQKEVLYNAFYTVFTDLQQASNVKVNNNYNMLKEPEFNNADKIRTILEKFDNQNMVDHIREDDEGVHIYIGSENEFDNDVAIIKTNYSMNGEEGTLALIGPKRMEYDKVTALLNYIKENIEKE
ncbi:MAG: heat-inducible transcriptional repressor HrcA [Bacilli bacterium]|nr:heat-inducible transcriptional repressor HrcA [Bacilli bacterium]